VFSTQQDGDSTTILINLRRSLPASTLDALKAFYAERDARAEEFNRLKVQAEAVHAAIEKPLSMEAFTEDWNESQFWVRFLQSTPSLPELRAGSNGIRGFAFPFF
jgi:hypothetical protein